MFLYLCHQCVHFPEVIQAYKVAPRQMGFVGLDVPDDLTNLTLGVEAGPHPRTPPRFRTGILALPMITDREHPVGWGVAWPAWTPKTKTFSGSEVVPLLAAAARILKFFMLLVMISLMRGIRSSQVSATE